MIIHNNSRIKARRLTCELKLHGEPDEFITQLDIGHHCSKSNISHVSKSTFLLYLKRYISLRVVSYTINFV